MPAERELGPGRGREEKASVSGFSSRGPWEHGLICLPARAIRVAVYKGDTKARKGGGLSEAEGGAQTDAHEAFQPDSCEGRFPPEPPCS